MNGIPTYTQTTVAFPTLPMDRSIVDEVSVSFDAKGGGTHGEFSFKFYSFGHDGWRNKKETIALQVAAFTDGGMSAMLDDRILPVIRRLARRRRDVPEVTPETLIQMLEENGVRASTHHLRGLYDKSYGRTEFWPLEARKAYQSLKRHEQGSRA